MTDTNPSAFLGTPHSIKTGHAGTVMLHAPFDVAQFHPDLFDRLGIALPDQLSSAIDKRRADFLAGRALLTHAFDVLGKPVQTVGIGPDRAPIWPAGFVGSISHTHNSCACILSTDASLRIGIDIETQLSANSDKAVRKITLLEGERALIAGHSTERQLAGLIFSAKETLFKALYPTVQSYFGFECAEVRVLPDKDQIRLNLTKQLHPDLPAGMAFDVRFIQLSGQILTWLIF